MRIQRRKRLSLRRRVTLALVALVALFVFALGILAVLSLDEQEDDLADAWVLAEAKRLAVRAERGDLQAPADAELFSPTSTLRAWLVEPGGVMRPEPLPAHLAGLREGVHWRTIGREELHIAVLATSRGRLVVQYDASATEARVYEFAIYLLVLWVLCVAVAYVVSSRVASIVVGPIERLTIQLGNWAPEASTTLSSASDEEDRLFDAFRRVQSRFEEVVAREREFVANVRHEIRTPLTALRTDLEMLAVGAQDDPARLERLQRALSMVDVVNAGLQSASVVSERGMAANQDIAVADCVDDAWASLQNDIGIERLQFVNAVPPTVRVRGDRHALLTILRNLIRNSAEHAAPARCVAGFRDGCIEIADDGPGIPPEDLPFVFERYYRGRYKDATGIETSDRGIGLAIARQIADLSGWTLTAHSDPATVLGPGLDQVRTRSEPGLDQVRTRSEPGSGARFVLRIG